MCSRPERRCRRVRQSRPSQFPDRVRPGVVRGPVAGSPDPRPNRSRPHTEHHVRRWPVADTASHPAPRWTHEWQSRDANTFVGDLHSERPGYVATITQKLSEPDPQSRDEALELLARLPGSPELVRALSQASDQGHISAAERAEFLTRALSNPVLPAPVPAPEASPDLPRNDPESYEDQERRDPRTNCSGRHPIQQGTWPSSTRSGRPVFSRCMHIVVPSSRS